MTNVIWYGKYLKITSFCTLCSLSYQHIAKFICPLSPSCACVDVTIITGIVAKRPCMVT